MNADRVRHLLYKVEMINQMNQPKFMKGIVKSAPVSRSDVMVKSVMAKSALWKYN